MTMIVMSMTMIMPTKKVTTMIKHISIVMSLFRRWFIFNSNGI
jgi:hypothetical protein